MIKSPWFIRYESRRKAEISVGKIEFVLSSGICLDNEADYAFCIKGCGAWKNLEKEITNICQTLNLSRIDVIRQIVNASLENQLENKFSEINEKFIPYCLSRRERLHKNDR